MVHAFFDPAQAAAFNAAASKKDSQFEVRYFPLHGLGNITRMLLASSGAKFTNFNPEDWAALKPEAPFGVMPLLKETTSDGTVIQIAESDAIERYLSKKFGYYGDNIFEETLIDTFVSSDNDIMNKIFGFIMLKDAEQKAEAKEKALQGPVANWVKNHELHLQNNGANGHYVGNKHTLADFKTAQLISIIQGFSGEDLISEKLTPALIKVRATVDKIPSLAAWRATDEWKAFADRNKAALGF
ncbi:Glutathione S-transferase S1 [Mortierella alpina]|uniref:Glutathione S-transferase S1 n=1 Tax=Mortierella alpina TaxID=64518 RepID=A0A9P6J530_MORAP|nr:Glutathione S-transferase S1 [Mortierella alpina]